MKMYILVRESVPLGFAVLASAHASLAAHLKFRDTPEIGEWLSGPFFKVVCRVTDAEFERAKAVEDHVVLTESALGGQEVAIAFRPRAEWPKSFQFLRLYRCNSNAQTGCGTLGESVRLNVRLWKAL